MHNNEQAVASIFEHYVNNRSDIYEIKFLLKQFITDDNEPVLKKLIAEQLSAAPFPKNVDPQTSQLLDSALTDILKGIK